VAGHTVVIVESPAKAKTINKYLGKDYTVIASFGHIRDLPPKDGSVRPDEDFAMDWEYADRGTARVAEITKAVKAADHVLLASDPDREGEAIAWHVLQALKEKKALGHATVGRITFNEITKTAVLEAIKAPRELDQELIDAYMARRALDYLVGFNLSPILWRKLPGSRSAGRVQSVALRLICERESEIEKFVPVEYWSVEADFQTPLGHVLSTRLTHHNGKKLDKLDLKSAADAQSAVAVITSSNFKIASIEHKNVKRHPAAPFTTSTLQQEASRKLGMGASRTMRCAQKLYEGVSLGGETVGLITYMRTDGVSLSADAIDSARGMIRDVYGTKYLPDAPRMYKAKAKNAQEAHEAIRPTDLRRRPEDVAAYLDGDEKRLYEMIWKRTVASQMESAEFDQAAVDVSSADGKTTLRATGSIVLFDGFLKLYFEDSDDLTADKDDARLPPVKEGEALKLDKAEGEKQNPQPSQHFTQPPPRYSEASLVKKLEELGIGRPSTYASIIEVLQNRNYVRLEGKAFVPEDRGRIVTSFLESFFHKYVEYDFTAGLEDQLDDISGGKANWKAVLRAFWDDFSGAINGAKDLTITQVIDELDEELSPHFFPSGDRGCPSCKSGRLGLKLGKFGAFIGCSNYPECKHTRKLSLAGTAEGDALVEGDKELGVDPITELPVSLKRGPYGLYVQLGPKVGPIEIKPKVEEPVELDKNGKPKKKKKAKSSEEKPKRTSIPRGLNPNEIDLNIALKLLELPRAIGPHPESGETIYAGIGRFGPYLKMGSTFKSIPKDDDVLSIGMNRAVTLMAEAKAKGPKELRDMGVHPDDDKQIVVMSGRYGPYLKHGKTMANLPKGTAPEALTLEQAIELINAKAAKGKKPAKKTTKAKAVAEDTEEKPAKKKTAAKKTTKVKKVV
jgi:DNA topoisomerase I